MANSSNAAPAMRKFSGSEAAVVDGINNGGGVHPSPHSHHAAAIDSSLHSGGGGRKSSLTVGASVASISSKPTPIFTRRMRFLIMDAPRQSNLHLYIRECRRNHVTDIVRVCEPTYLGSELTSAGIQLHEMAYEDGHSPPEPVLQRWLALVEERFLLGGGGGGNSNNKNGGKSDQKTIAVHCVAGLGRAPVLVAIALMEFEGMDAVEAVMMIRGQRRGAINEKQLRYLEGYKCR
eukprot:CAMPEP_0172528272 /NCGR_PEP_ID=MMETSP1067-20121228/2717_1 /TAXON_ID=265564 ORGANISM="Thalassiosira punctigera, Strain Tpunct2005C2" /NCGR_SAMPLE_ID=MMETSP1067 /ASSEMBLY_ACC=CAM_ASM_000444 /LENGTH=233 /DNA_ID=CAMNT_0013312153 /DNA_START=273 /DNA_END=971 /DNA_ORIENTATION=+